MPLLPQSRKAARRAVWPDWPVVQLLSMTAAARACQRILSAYPGSRRLSRGLYPGAPIGPVARHN